VLAVDEHHESREPGVTVRIGSTAPVSAGNPWRAVKNGCPNRISEVWRYHALVVSPQRAAIGCGRPVLQ
jgi:hypothetical protein